jgi:hypothetical protein
MNPTTARRPWVWIYGLTVVVMFIAISVFVWLALESRRDAGAAQAIRRGPIPAERFQLLAQFAPPAYLPGAEQTTHTHRFDQAMESYLKHDCAGAIAGLRASVEAGSDGPAAAFYLGICTLLTGDPDSGIKDLRLAIATGGVPYIEQAKYYLAKALIGRQDIASARAQLESVIAMHGALEQQSKSILAQIADPPATAK